MTETEREEILRQLRRANGRLKWYLRIVMFLVNYILLTPVVWTLEPFDDDASNVIVLVLLSLALLPITYWLIFSPFEAYGRAIQALLKSEPVATNQTSPSEASG